MMSLSSLVPSPQGVVTVKGLVDREKGDFYTLTVVADDGGPKVDSTVVSGTPGERPTGRARHRPKVPQNIHLHRLPHTRGRLWVRIWATQGQCYGHNAIPSWAARARDETADWLGGSTPPLGGSWESCRLLTVPTLAFSLPWPPAGSDYRR